MRHSLFLLSWTSVCPCSSSLTMQSDDRACLPLVMAIYRTSPSFFSMQKLGHDNEMQMVARLRGIIFLSWITVLPEAGKSDFGGLGCQRLVFQVIVSKVPDGCPKPNINQSCKSSRHERLRVTQGFGCSANVEDLNTKRLKPQSKRFKPTNTYRGAHICFRTSLSQNSK